MKLYVLKMQIDILKYCLLMIIICIFGITALAMTKYDELSVNKLYVCIIIELLLSIIFFIINIKIRKKIEEIGKI
ncbi:MAG: hypothetical protein IJT33_01920 [Campylobacter sp.]|nr:hypothetical protein [Campylobacter sp.]MBQ7270614.1 hypothetical protein [Campylobacter sp.]MBQ7675210.1 hypothetical protein [Campylobacter sp.]MBQ9875842.1 hypothetical protein [Campylobacter sp.]